MNLRFNPWLRSEEEGLKCMLNSGVSDHDIDTAFYTYPDEERLFKGPGPGIKWIALTGEEKTEERKKN